MIVCKENLDCNTHLEFVLGEHMQALDKQNKTNNNKPRSLDYLFLCPNAAKQGGYKLFHLPANKIIMQRKI